MCVSVYVIFGSLPLSLPLPLFLGLVQVIAGHTEAIDFIKEHRQKFDLKRVKLLSVSGAFHTQLMAPAKEEVEALLQGMRINQPILPVYSNVTATYYR